MSSSIDSRSLQHFQGLIGFQAVCVALILALVGALFLIIFAEIPHRRTLFRGVSALLSYSLLSLPPTQPSHHRSRRISEIIEDAETSV